MADDTTQTAAAPETAAGTPSGDTSAVKAADQAATTTGAPGGTEAPVERSYEMTIDGVKKMIPAPVIEAYAQHLGLDPEDVIRDGQIQKASFDRMRQVAAENKKLQALADAMKQDPARVLRYLAQVQGIDPAAYQRSVEQYLLEQYQMTQMTPEQRQLLALEQENKRLAEIERRQHEAEEEARRQRAVEAETPRLEAEFTEALKTVNFPRTPQFFAQMAQKMLDYDEAGIELKAADAARIVKKDMMAQASAIRRELKTIDDVRRVFGDDLIQQIRKLDVDNLRSSQPGQKNQTAPPARAAAVQEAPKRRLSMEEAEAEKNRALEAFFANRR